MITFDDIRVEVHETYLFLPMDVAKELCWFLRQNNIGYRGYHCSVVRYRNDTELEGFSNEEIQQALQPFLDLEFAGFRLQRTACIITHFNLLDLRQKALALCTDSQDPDYKAYQEAEYHLRKEKMLIGRGGLTADEEQALPEKKAVDYEKVRSGSITPEELEMVRWNAEEALVAEAQDCMGALYEKGYGVVRDCDRAIAWYGIAWRLRHYEPAVYHLGLCYVNRLEQLPFDEKPGKEGHIETEREMCDSMKRWWEGYTPDGEKEEKVESEVQQRNTKIQRWCAELDEF